MYQSRQAKDPAHRKRYEMRLLRTMAAIIPVIALAAAGMTALAETMGSKSYDDFETPEVCLECHVNNYRQWEQTLMSQCFTHHWDEIEYFKLALPHSEIDEMVAEVKAGCNGCHAPLAFMAGDIPPPRPAMNSRANESVSCDVCHTMTGYQGDVPYNFNYISTPGETKFGPKKNIDSPHHLSEYNEFITSTELCGTCHNERSPYGAWVKSTQLEWQESPYSKRGVRCQDCHAPRAWARSSIMSDEDSVAQHLFHGAHDPGKLAGSVEIRMHPAEREVSPGDEVELRVQLYNAKAGHKIPTGSVEDRIMWLHVTAIDPSGKAFHLPVDQKGFDGEEYTIAADVLAYQDMGIPLGIENFEGVQRDGIPVGDRIFRMPYFDPEGRMTIMQWNTKSFGPDYRIGPRETKTETYTWRVPPETAPGETIFNATLNYQKLVKPVAEFLEVPAEESEIITINRTSTWVDVSR
jgi:hypothetical protein